MPAEQSISIGPIIAGVLASAYFCGVFLCQIGVYFTLYPRDPEKIKRLVVCVGLLDFVQEVLVCCTLYYYAVQHRTTLGTPSDQDVPWQLMAGVILNCIVIALCQGFFALRVWRLSYGNKVLACLICSTLVGGLALGFGFGILNLAHLDFPTIHSTSRLYSSMSGLHAGCDCIVTGSLLWMIWKQKDANMRHSNMVRRIMVYTFHTGAVPCLGALANLIIVVVTPNKGISIAVYAVMGRLYSNAFLIMVNARKSFRDEVKRDNEVKISGISGIVASNIIRSAAISTACTPAVGQGLGIHPHCVTSSSRSHPIVQHSSAGPERSTSSLRASSLMQSLSQASTSRMPTSPPLARSPSIASARRIPSSSSLVSNASLASAHRLQRLPSSSLARSPSRSRSQALSNSSVVSFSAMMAPEPPSNDRMCGPYFERQPRQLKRRVVDDVLALGTP